MIEKKNHKREQPCNTQMVGINGQFLYYREVAISISLELELIDCQ